ncbi:MAG: stage III sporulation protein AF [Lachnospiraceae bacterium]|nr:stage III sporulation protein AF [Lachnospiraceae bacterium]
MENELLAYIKGILCFVLFSSLLLQLFPRAKDKKYLELTIGLIFLYLVMRPVLSALKNYDKILDSSYFTVDFDSSFLEEQQEEFETQTGVAMINNMEQQMELMGYENTKLTMKKSGNSWVLFVEVEQNLTQDWEEEKKNLKNFISNVYNLDEDNINIEIRG